jgi:hypothetical protein
MPLNMLRQVRMLQLNAMAWSFKTCRQKTNMDLQQKIWSINHVGGLPTIYQEYGTRPEAQLVPVLQEGGQYELDINDT